jgi:hypothetical protein
MRLFGIFLILISAQSFAGRKMMHFPFTVKSYSGANNDQKFSVVNNFAVQVVNISNVEQKIKIKFVPDQLVVNICHLAGAIIAAPWTHTSGCWYNITYNGTHGFSSTILEKEIPNLAGLSSDQVGFSTQCFLTPSGMQCTLGAPVVQPCNVHTTILTLPATTCGGATCISTLGTKQSGRVEVEVDQDKGAIIANLNAVSGICGSNDAITDNFNFPLNGGRPF